MPHHQRKTVDTYQIHVNYGQGWEHECTEFTRKELRENVKAYRSSCSYPLKIVRKRMPISQLSQHERTKLGV